MIRVNRNHPGTQEFDGKAAIEFSSYNPGTTTITARSAAPLGLG